VGAGLASLQWFQQLFAPQQQKKRAELRGTETTLEVDTQLFSSVAV